ncbi:TonB-dependent receptor domain-containing protein [Vibrio cholerae]|uniref:TonB-dependent receptor domain-containing protein n=1 Tax=Vibrio cholerae TaxID=666 RepID=UPI001182C8A4|nr:TonB-dependent receptor [Vibrio cholerae]MBJ6953135.1 TonB-dependent receptor [Vibrio cholerae]TVN18966.1 TonB-dependent receptor [Vibrio cholerae]
MKYSLLASAIATLVSTSAFAAATDTAETIVVTANRVEQGINEQLSPIDVITKQQIKDLKVESLAELLKRLPGVQVANNGGPGATSNFYIRGRSGRNVLVMINGIRVGSSTTGTANLNALPIKSVERIEILRGPRASVYGSDAVSGVINLITSEKGSDASSVSAGIGSKGRRDANASLATSTDNAWFSVSANTQSADGYNVLPDSTNPVNTDDDGYNNTYATVDGGYQINDQLTVKGTAYYQNGKNDFDSGYATGGADQNEDTTYNLGLVTEYKGSNLLSSLTVGHNKDKSESYGNGSDASDISTTRSVITWQNNYALNDSTNLMAGLEYNNEKVDNVSIDYVDDDRHTQSVYFGTSKSGEDYLIEGNVRLDDSDAYGTFTTYQLGAGYDIDDSHRLTAMYGTSYKAPTFNQLYWPRQCDIWGCYEGNANLVPEEAQSGEVALEASYDFADLRVAYHHSEIENMISSANSSLDNIGKAQVKGVEFVASFDTFGIFHEVSYDYLDAKNKDTDKQLVRRARNSAKWNMSYEISDFKFDVSYLYQGKRYNDASNKVELGGYSLTDIAMTYQITEQLSCGAKVGNVFDKEYETVKGFVTPERNYYANVTYDF